MAIDFPTSPSIGQVYTYGSRSWEWTGDGWMSVSSNAANDITPMIIMKGF